VKTNICTKESPYDNKPVPDGERWAHFDAKCVDEEYNGLSGGGDYEVYECPHCGVRFRTQLPD
jgi:hypothetical protein